MNNTESSTLTSFLKELSVKNEDGNDDGGRAASQLLQENPRLFVETYWKNMTTNNIVQLREHISDDGFFTYFSRKIRNFRRKSEIQQRNRRFLAMKELVEKGEFFTLGEMKTRNPVLYDELVGQLLSNADVDTLAREEYNTYNTASQMLLGQIDHLRTTELYYKMLEKEGEKDMPQTRQQMEAEEEVEEEEEEEEETAGIQRSAPAHSAEEKNLMTREFVSQMEERFLSGADDAVINYKEISGPSMGKIGEQDEEDAYFDSEDADSSTLHMPSPADIHTRKTETAPEKSAGGEEEEDYMTMDISKF